MELSRTQTAAALAAIAVSIGALAWWVVERAGSAGEPVVASPQVAQGPTVSPQVAQGPTVSPFGSMPAGALPRDEAAPAAASGAAAGDVAAGVQTAALTPEEEAVLRDAVKDHPNAAAEFERLRLYALLQKRVERWQALKDGPLTAERRALAQQIMNEVPGHLQRREMLAGEALLLNMALLEDIEPDAARREQRVAQLRAQLMAQANTPDAETSLQQAADIRKMEEFNRRKRLIDEQFFALPEAQRDMNAYTAQLDALRREVFDGQ
ncbi:hypothetical protein [Acidovorax sp. 210-6]|uniref:hypothetical protein n=1 Tax=Acidovorax sp. 210-6 TaxID=2699468 RepID=UPI00138A65F4|nr:hypothetical protein [Acidovorax sp. 210-6]